MLVEKQDWKQLSSIQIGGAICLPVIIIGQTLSKSYGFFTASIAIILGNLLLLLLGLVAAKMSYEKNKTTMENAVDYFGEKGIFLFALSMAFSLLCWFAIQLNMMSISLLDLLSIDNENILYLTGLNISLGLAITVVALWGLRAINVLANISLPLLFLTLGYALYSVSGTKAISERIFMISGTSFVIASAILVVIDLPTYFKHSRSPRDGYISIGIIFGLVMPFLQIIGVYLADGMVEGTILDTLKREGNPWWNLWIASFLILAGWTTNNLNLYSGVMSLELVFKRMSLEKLTFLFGGLGTFLSFFNLLNHLERVLDIMGIFISSMGAVVLTRYLLDQFTHYVINDWDHKLHLTAWAIGIVVGFLSLYGYSLTGISLLDAMLGACAATHITLFRWKSHEKAYLR